MMIDEATEETTEQQQALVLTDPQRRVVLRDMLQDAAQNIVLTHEMDLETLIRIVNLATTRNPRLLQCAAATIVTSAMVSARLGLACDGILGSAYLVPFYNKKNQQYECQLIIGYRGLIDLARKSGAVSKVETHLVYEQDVFEVDFGAVRPVSHRPSYKSDRGDWYLVWGMATFTDGTVQAEIMTRDQVNEIKKRAQSDSVWKKDGDEMARKSVVRRLCKYLPLTPNAAAAMALQVGAEGGASTVIDVGRTMGIELPNATPDAPTMSATILDTIEVKPEPEAREATAAEKLGDLLRDAADRDAAAAVWTEHEAEIDGFTDDERAELQAIFEGKRE